MYENIQTTKFNARASAMERQPIKLPLRVLSSPHTWRVESWHVTDGAEVHKGQRVVTFRNDETAAVEHALTPGSGRVVERSIDVGGQVGEQDVVGYIEECTHPVIFGGVCAVCGSDVSTVHFGEVGRSKEEDRMKVAYAGEGLRITRNEAEVMETRNAKRLYSEKRLSLVLDLDHTLVHATDDPRANAIFRLKEAIREDDVNRRITRSKKQPDSGRQKLSKAHDKREEMETYSRSREKVRPGKDGCDPKSEKSEVREQKNSASSTVDEAVHLGKSFDTIIPVLDSIHKFSLPNCPQPMYVKLRPGLRDFLRKCSQLFELHIYTMGTSSYAAKIASLIDPDKSLFAGRITSRDHFREGRFNQKNIGRLFPCDDSMVVIVDDREDVWLEPRKYYGALYMPNLVKARPYTFWNGLREVYERNNTAPLNGLSNSQPSKVVNHSPSELDSQGQRFGANLSSSSGPAAEISTRPTTSGSDTLTGAGENGKSKIKHDERDAVLENSFMSLCHVDEDDRIHSTSPVHLDQLAEVLKKCHARFFTHAKESSNGYKPLVKPVSTWVAPADVKRILDDMRKEVLRDCVISFSRVCPPFVHVPSLPIWRLAIRYGAVCKELYDDEVTHVVAHRQFGSDSEKSRLARVSEGKYVVSPEWLKYSCEGWRREDETRYTIKSTGVDAFRGPQSIHAGHDEIDPVHLGTSASNGVDQEKARQAAILEVTSRPMHLKSISETRVDSDENRISNGGDVSEEEGDDHSFVAALEAEMLEDDDHFEVSTPSQLGTGNESPATSVQLIGTKRRRE